jgi:hypothetical protein
MSFKEGGQITLRGYCGKKSKAYLVEHNERNECTSEDSDEMGLKKTIRRFATHPSFS